MSAFGICSVCKLVYLVLSLLGCYLSPGASTQGMATAHHDQHARAQKGMAMKHKLALCMQLYTFVVSA